MTNLRDQLADHLWLALMPHSTFRREESKALADSVLAFLRERDGHAEFVRKIREQADDVRFTDDYSINRIIAMCHAELA